MSPPSWGRARLATRPPTALARRFEVNFLCEGGDIAFHVKPRFSSATVVGNAFQGGHWGQEEVSSVVPLALGQPFEVTGPGGGAGAPWAVRAGSPLLSLPWAR